MPYSNMYTIHVYVDIFSAYRGPVLTNLVKIPQIASLSVCQGARLRIDFLDCHCLIIIRGILKGHGRWG